MDRDWLAARLGAGDSIEAIAREVGKHPSTVAFWANRHWLASVHAERHAARGAIAREVLVELVCEGLRIHAIATRLDCSAATVPHWLRRHGVETHRGAQLRASREGRERGDPATMRVCGVHESTPFVVDRDATTAVRVAAPNRSCTGGRASARR